MFLKKAPRIMSLSPKTKAKQLREPPPTLFLGPPSQNASLVSLPNLPIATTNISLSLNSPAQRPPLIHQRSQRQPTMRGNLNGPGEATISSPPLPLTGLPRQQQDSLGQNQADRTDALWAEMQTTLEEVEVSAFNSTHVFGPEHSRALEGLRMAQIGLAQAWARSEADDVAESREEAKEREKEREKDGKARLLSSDGKSALDGGNGTEGPKSTGASGSGRPGSSGMGAEKMGTKLEEETEADILLARKRREANDKYFQRVNGGVLDVVAKLEEVAAAMKAVEQESRDIWGESDSASLSLHG